MTSATATVAPAGASHAYVQGTRITNYTPVLVESPALRPPSTLGSRTFLFAVDDAQAWQSFEQSGALQGLKYSVVVPQGIGIPGAHQIDVSTEESLKDGLARLKSVAADTIGRDALRMLDASMRWVVEPGEFRILIGASSEDIRLRGTLTVR